jgi:hypothetical protein
MHALRKQQRFEEHNAIDNHDLCRFILPEHRKQTALAGTGWPTQGWLDAPDARSGN